MLKIAEWSVKEWQASKSTTGWDEEDQVPHRQIFQLQQSYCVVRFHILWDQSKSEVCVLKNSLPLLSLRPVLSTLYLHVHTLLHYNHTTQASHIHNTCTHSICTLEAFQAKRVCLYRCDRYGTVWYKDTGMVCVSLTEPFSITRFSITTPRQRCSHTISQKWPQVFGNGP